MFGYVEWTQENGRIAAEETEILNLRFWSVAIPRKAGTPEFLLRRRCESAARRLQRLGVTRAVFPENFTQWDAFSKYGIRPTDPLPLYRALAAQLVQCALDSRTLSERTAVVAVRSDRLTMEVQQAVTELCVRNRYVLLDAPDRDGDLCRRLRREYGVPLVQTGDAEQLGRADVAVCFSPVADRGAGQTVLELYPGGVLPRGRLTLSPERETQIPAGCNRRQLLAALRIAGAVRTGQITVLAPEEKQEKEEENQPLLRKKTKKRGKSRG